MTSFASQPFRPAVVAPTYNNARTLRAVLDALAANGLPVIAVNDGSSDETTAILKDWLAAASHELPERHVVSHKTNRGKAQAMASGFQRARELGFTHALTIDTDGQHDVADVSPMIDLASSHTESLVVGARPTAGGYPIGSRIGRVISNLLIWIECGVRVDDSQCGLRVYPLARLAMVPTFADRFGFETEVITRFAWAGGDVRQLPIRCIYEVPGGRTSHFRPWRDSFSASVMHARLLLRSALPWTTPKPIDPSTDHGTAFERLINWFNPARTWRQMRDNPAAREKLASGFATGVFIATIPAYGLKTVLCLAAAKVMKAPPLLLIASSSAFNLSVTSPLTAAASIATGHLLLSGEWPSLAHYDLAHDGFWQTFRQIGLEWLLGSLIVGMTLAAIAYLVVRLLINQWTSRPTDDGPLAVLGEG